jgi:hypothetical protein
MAQFSPTDRPAAERHTLWSDNPIARTFKASFLAVSDICSKPSARQQKKSFYSDVPSFKYIIKKFTTYWEIPRPNWSSRKVQKKGFL